ncbi:hypothetical protein PP304_gp033 [Gordonia phage Phendrix]|uniref:Uncharacterized protein n=2 Tax=Godonkavirus TaxID=2733178 RepID=A0A4D6E3N0_9CAUD|nr:hypothetical protein HOV33_gp033 [Gordonia phage GodonK]YP_010649077.1 hypothetical protein PP304_gp033 [Gordonia phage Phendrix]QBZ72652.1 hypothetical protein SEA_GODONK_33 [Gordonia phage GodonK]QDK02581.1 hypothetical protein SEA_PHENDRIX_33 [Gordonia phage Phendrix]
MIQVLPLMVSAFHQPNIISVPDPWTVRSYQARCTCGWNGSAGYDSVTKEKAENSWGYHHIREVFKACNGEAEISLYSVGIARQVLGRDL